MRPDWLPSPLVLGGSLLDDYAQLYKIFKKDIFSIGLKIDNIPIIINPDIDPLMPSYERGFTHLVTRDDGTGMRTIDYARATKIHWIPAIIQNCKEPDVRAFWSATPKGETLYLWLHEHDYILVLRWTSKSQNRKILLTAYTVDTHKRRYYERLYTSATRVL